jgi:hypothetical protein
MEKRDLEAVADVLRGDGYHGHLRRNLAELTYGGEHVSFASLPGMYERTILVSGFSKAFAMTGWRSATHAAGADHRADDEATPVRHHVRPHMAQYAGIEAMKNGVPDIAEMRASYDERRKLLFDGFRRMGLSCFEPRGAFYMFPSIRSTGLSSEEFCTRFLSEERVAVIPAPRSEQAARACALLLRRLERKPGGIPAPHGALPLAPEIGILRNKEAILLKYVLIIGDVWLTTRSVPGGRTPLEYAKTPAIDALAKKARSAAFSTCRRASPAADTAILSIFGCDPRQCLHRPRAAGGGRLRHRAFTGDAAYRCNKVTFEDGDMPFSEKKILSHSAGSIEGSVSDALVTALFHDTGFKALADEAGMEVYPASSFRHIACSMRARSA